MKMRSFGIPLISFILTSIVIGNAYYQKKQFYPSVVYITKSNPSMAVLYIQAFIIVLLIGKLMRKVFFGQLRAAEFEHLVERSWYAVTETCLAFTVFRDDFNSKFVALFTVLLFLKSFHWLAEDRVDYMERSPVIGWLFHLRVLSLLHVLGLCDMYFVAHAYQSTVTKGASVQLVFGFEYAILLTMVVNIIIKYALHSVDLNSENPWENKAVLLLYTELVMGFIKVILYISFVAIMVRIYTLPLFAFRPMYYAMRNFKKAFNDVILSRRAIRNMNTLYPDATPEELQAADNVCIICREEMVTASKKLPCNHIFHTACLRSWFQRQQTCPTCRLNILRQTVNQPAARPGGVPQRGDLPAGGGQQAGDRVEPAPPNPFQFFAGVHPFHIPPMWGIPPPVPPVVAGLAAQQQQQQQQPVNANRGTTDSTRTSTVTTSSTSSATPSTSTFTSPAPPLPPFAFIPFSVPPPLPKLSTLTPEQLQQLEGNERRAVEERIQLLRNIQLMLDSSVAMMQQYTFITSATQNNRTNSENNASTTNTEASTSSDKNTNNTSNPPTETDELRMRRLNHFQNESTNNNSSTTKIQQAPDTSISSDTISSTDNSSKSETNELRMRRLQHFKNDQQSQQQTPTAQE